MMKPPCPDERQDTDHLLIFVCLGQNFLFDLHVLEFVGVENLATELAFDKLDIVFTRNDAHLGVLAGSRGIHDDWRRENRRMGRIVTVSPGERKRVSEDSCDRPAIRPAI
jgi:hypothetical protein